MDQRQVSTYTRRIVSGNRSEIIVVLYEIYFSYAAEAAEALGKKDYETARGALRHCGQVLQHLKDALDFKYEVSGQLYSLYDFCQRQVARANYTARTDALDEAAVVMRSLQEAFEAVAKEDDSGPLMQNTQQMTAGYTYGRTDITETMDAKEINRGFLA